LCRRRAKKHQKKGTEQDGTQVENCNKDCLLREQISGIQKLRQFKPRRRNGRLPESGRSNKVSGGGKPSQLRNADTEGGGKDEQNSYVERENRGKTNRKQISKKTGQKKKGQEGDPIGTGEERAAGRGKRGKGGGNSHKLEDRQSYGKCDENPNWRV